LAWLITSKSNPSYCRRGESPALLMSFLAAIFGIRLRKPTFYPQPHPNPHPSSWYFHGFSAQSILGLLGVILRQIKHKLIISCFMEIVAS
jgi:hypothetical protein